MTPIISITNLQGVPSHFGFYQSFKAEYGINPFNFLVKRVQVMAATINPDCEVRGLKNPRHRESCPLYNATFRREKVARYSTGKPAIEF